MSAPIVFMDTETTGLDLDDDIWEYAGIRREPDGSERELHMFIEHDVNKCKQLPGSFYRDHSARFREYQQFSRAQAAFQIQEFTQGAHVVGAVPNFDTERLALLLNKFGHRPKWHYHLIDVENLAVGWLYGREGYNAVGIRGSAGPLAVHLPWDSDKLSTAVGVVPPGEGVRHTAMGDARWVRDLYDAITKWPKP